MNFHSIDKKDILSLSSPSLVEILTYLESRYLTEHQSYTFLGQLLLSLSSTNPSFPNDIHTLYDPSMDLLNMPTHIWKLSSSVVQYLWNEKEENTNDDSHHTIYLTGKCGSGKTENMKLLIQYLSYFCFSMSSMKISPPNIQPRIESITSLLNPFIEAVHGTHLNSTRCGSHVRFFYDPKFNYHGVFVDIFGLEVNRVANLIDSNFHIFYMICCEESELKRTKYHIQSADNYRYLKFPQHSVFLDHSLNAENFYHSKYLQFLTAIENFTKDSELVMDGLIRAIMAILTIGNIEFDSGSLISPEATDNSDTNVQNNEMTKLFKIVADLLDIDVYDLISSLTTRTVVVSLESITITLNPEQCNQMREIFCKTLYLCVCEWFVGFINTELFNYDCTSQQQIESIEDIWKSTVSYLNSTQQHKRFSNSGYSKGYSSKMPNSNVKSLFKSIGIIDMYGFEDLSTGASEAADNSLDQLLANYASEKMQHSFERYISQEQNFYYDEGIHWESIDVSNSCQLAIQLINGNYKAQKTLIPSLISVIDEISSTTLPSLETTSEFAGLLYLTFQDSPAFLTTSVNKIKGEFTVRHYSHSVTYSVAEFLVKNQTYYFPLEDLLAPSNNNSMRQYASVFSTHFGDEIPASSILYQIRHSKKDYNVPTKSFFNLISYSTSRLFCQGIDEIMTTLALTESHHVKCLIAMEGNETFSKNNLLSQLRSEGVITAFNLFSAVYPVQFTYADFWEKYEPLITDVLTEERIHMASISEQIVHKSTNTPKKKEWTSVLSELENKMNCDGVALKKVIPRVADFSTEKKRRLSLGRLSNNLVGELAITLAALRHQGLGGGDADDVEEPMDVPEGVTHRKYLGAEEADDDTCVINEPSHRSGTDETVIKISDDAKLSAGVDVLIARYERQQSPPNSDQGASYQIQRGKTQIFMKEPAFQWLTTLDAKYHIPRRAAIVIQKWFRSGSFRKFVDHKYTRRKLFSKVVVPLQRMWRWKSQIHSQLINEEKWQRKKSQLVEKNPTPTSVSYSKQSPLDLYKHDAAAEGDTTTSPLLLANRTVLWVIFSHYMDASVSKSGTISLKRKYVTPIVTPAALCELLRDWAIAPQLIPLSTVEIFISEAISRTLNLDAVRLSTKDLKSGKKKITQNMISYSGFTIVLLLIAIELESHHQNHHTQVNSRTNIAEDSATLSIINIKEADIARANPLEYCVRGLKIILTSMDHSKGRQKFISSRSSVIVPAFCTSSGVKHSLNKDASPPVKLKDTKALNVTPINTHLGHTHSTSNSKKTPKELQFPPMTPPVHDIIKKNEQTLVAMAFSYGSNPSLPPSPQLQSHFSVDSSPSNYAEFASLKTIQKREAVSITLEGIWNMLKDFEICPKFCRYAYFSQLHLSSLFSKSKLKDIFTAISSTHQVAPTANSGSLSYTGYVEVLNCVAQNFMSRGSPEDKLRNMFYAMNMSTGRSKCVSKRLSGILPPLQIQSSAPSPASHTPTNRGRDSVPSTSSSSLRHRRASTGTSVMLIRAHSRSLSPKPSRSMSESPGSWLDTNNDNLLYWLSEVLKDDNGVKISHEALLDVHAAFQRAYISTVSALAAIPESDMTYTELKSLGIGPLGVRTMIISAHKKLQSRNHHPPLSVLPTKPGDRRRGSEDSTSSVPQSAPTTPKASRSAASQLFSKVSSLSESPEQITNRPSPVTIPPQVNIVGNQIYVSVSKPLGMNLAENVPDEPLGVHIEKIVPDGNASQCGVLKCGYILREVCGKDAMEMEFDDIMDILRDAPFDTPIKMIFIDPTKNEIGEDIQGDGTGEDRNDTTDDDEGRSFSFDDDGDEEDPVKQNEGNDDNEEEIENTKMERKPRLLLRRKSSLT